MMLRNLLPEEYTITNMPSESKNKTKWLSSLKAMPIGLRRIENSVLDSIKHKTVGGIKIKASGRLTKRIIAARSITKVRQIGTIRNINSSYKGLSSVILRGHLRSNMEFAKAKNKSRIGSFGLKGWVSTV